MESVFTDRPIVVGFDGSAHAKVALSWAVEEAVRLAAPLAVVYAIAWQPEFAEVTSPETDLRVRERAQQIVDAATAAVARHDRRVRVSATVESGHPVTVLCEASRQARMLVLGSRGHGGFAGLIAGSVSIAVATHAHCPVAVVRDVPADAVGLPIAVGIDDSPQSRLALDVAFAEAQARGVPLLAVRAWRPPTPTAHGVAPFLRTEEIAEVESAERRFLHETVGPVAARHGDVPVEERLVDGPAAAALTDVASKAQLVVVGSRGRGGFAGLLLGSVGMQLLHYARCPVVVVRESATIAAGTP